jgi:hypothetical protein
MDLKSLKELKGDWEKVLAFVDSRFKINSDLQGILFLIGVQELGQGAGDFSKEEKQDLMHIAICRLLSDYGYYELLGTDDDGWPHWHHVKSIPKLSLKHQDILLKQSIINYFKGEMGVVLANNN